MAFIESPRLPAGLARGAVGGPTFLTDVVELESGHEQRNGVWSEPRQRYSISFINRTQAEIDALNAYIRITRGRLNGFRFRDLVDYLVTVTNGRFGTGAVGTGAPTYQLYKRYSSGSSNVDRKITKPVSGAVSVFRSAAPVTIGAGAGEIAIDATTGIVTFVADAQQNVTAVAVGATTDVTLAAALAPLGIGEKLWLQDLTGTVAATLNNLAHTITNIAGAVYTISTVTTGLAWTSGGTGRAYPQASETLTWSGQFDVPVRFDTDAMRAEASRTQAGGAYTWSSIELVELRPV
jgi:uncharacterized protein (TIGR02217 family)